MRILIGADTYLPDVNGAARFTDRLARGLAGRGHDVHIVCPSTDGQPATERHDGLTVHRLRSVRYRFHETLRICLPWHARSGAQQIVASVHPDVVHVQSHMVVGRALSRAAKDLGRGLIATNHFMPENVFSYMPYLPRALRGRAARWMWRDLGSVFASADLITAPTLRAVELLRAETGLGGLPVSCGIDADNYHPMRTQPVPAPADPTILFVGRLDPEKRIDELVRAFARLSPVPHPRLEIVGDGPERSRLEQLAVQLGVDDRVRVCGRLSDAELLAAYRRAAIFCMPGVAELQSLVTLEAMSAGKPVVAANAMALPHLVHPGENGWLYQPGNAGELAMRLATLIGDPKLRHRMGERSVRIAATHGLNATLDQFEGLYATVISPSQRRLTVAA